MYLLIGYICICGFGVYLYDLLNKMKNYECVIFFCFFVVVFDVFFIFEILGWIKFN